MTTPQRIGKRIFDLVVSSTMILSTLPLIVILIISSRLSTGASGVYRQTRIGKHGSRFSLYKIRTMKPEVITDLPITDVTVAGDPRVTEFGGVLRRYKLDELPQLWNVLVGEMSLVGPRPDVPGYADKLVGEARDILNVRPGVTGPASIKYRNEGEILAGKLDPVGYNNNVLFPDKVEINLTYIRDYSLIGDFKYILMTLKLYQVPSELLLD